MKEHLSTLRWLSRVSGREKLNILLLTLAEAGLGGSSVAFAMLLRSLIDSAVKGDRAGLARSAALLIALLLLQLLLSAAERFLREWTLSGLENRLRERLFGCLLRRDYAAVTAIHSGEWMNRLTSDTYVVAKNLTELLPALGGMLVRLVGAVAAIVVLEPVFALVLVPGGFLLVLVTYLMRRSLKRMHKQVQEADGRVRVYLQERLSSMLIVRSFGMEQATDDTAREKMREHRRLRIRRSLFSNLCGVGFSAVIRGAYVAAAIYCAAAIFSGTMSYGTLMAILQLISQVQQPFANLSALVPQYYAMLASAERLIEAESFPQEETGCLPQEEVRRFYRDEFRGLGLRDVCFTYQPPVREDEETPQPVVLSGLSLDIEKGDYVAFTGHSGSGKSTVLKLLMSLYPLDSGARYLRSTRGEQELDASWRGLFAYVPQGNQLLSGSIREIVAFGDKDGMRREEELRRALTIACADEFVDGLERGLDTRLGEGGAGLSEGQMQRIAIARAVFSDRPILLLDEATSSLDAITEQEVLANLRAMTDKTVLIVTHRPAALAVCDKQIHMAENAEDL